MLRAGKVILDSGWRAPHSAHYWKCVWDGALFLGINMILEPFPSMAYTPVLMIPLENLLNSPVLEKYACFLYPLIDFSPGSKVSLSVKPR